jgi:hypothetical protein
MDANFDVESEIRVNDPILHSRAIRIESYFEVHAYLSVKLFEWENGRAYRKK